MFERPRHQTIHQLIASFNGKLLTELDCHSGGGTAIVALLEEYREHMGPDFLCSDRNRFRN